MDIWTASCPAPYRNDVWFQAPNTQCSLDGTAFVIVLAVFAAMYLLLFSLSAISLPNVKDDTARKQLFMSAAHSGLGAILMLGTLLNPGTFNSTNLATWVVFGPFLILFGFHVVFGTRVLRMWGWAAMEVNRQELRDANEARLMKISSFTSVLAGFGFSVVVPSLSQPADRYAAWCAACALYGTAMMTITLVPIRYGLMVTRFLSQKRSELTMSPQDEAQNAHRVWRIHALQLKLRFALAQALASLALTPAVWIALIFHPIAPLVFVVAAASMGMSSFCVMLYFERPRLSRDCGHSAEFSAHEHKLEKAFRYLGGVDGHPVVIALQGVLLDDRSAPWLARVPMPRSNALYALAVAVPVLCPLVLRGDVHWAAGLVVLGVALCWAAAAALAAIRVPARYLLTMPHVQLRVAVVLAALAATCYPADAGRVLAALAASVTYLASLFGDAFAFKARHLRGALALASAVAWTGIWVCLQFFWPPPPPLPAGRFEDGPGGGAAAALALAMFCLTAGDAARRLVGTRAYMLVNVQLPLRYVLETYATRSNRFSVNTAVSGQVAPVGEFVYVVANGSFVSDRTRRGVWLAACGLVWLAGVLMAAGQSVAASILVCHGAVGLLASSSLSVSMTRQAGARVAAKLAWVLVLAVVACLSLAWGAAVLVAAGHFVMLALVVLTTHADASAHPRMHVGVYFAGGLIAFTTLPVLLAAGALPSSGWQFGLRADLPATGLNLVRPLLWSGVLAAVLGLDVALDWTKSVWCRSRGALWGLRMDTFAQFRTLGKEAEPWAKIDGVDVILQHSNTTFASRAGGSAIGSSTARMANLQEEGVPAGAVRRQVTDVSVEQ